MDTITPSFPPPPRTCLGHDLVAVQFRDEHPARALAQVAVHFEDWDPDFMHSLSVTFDVDEASWVAIAIVDTRCDPAYEFGASRAVSA